MKYSAGVAFKIRLTVERLLDSQGPVAPIPAPTQGVQLWLLDAVGSVGLWAIEAYRIAVCRTHTQDGAYPHQQRAHSLLRRGPLRPIPPLQLHSAAVRRPRTERS